MTGAGLWLGMGAAREQARRVRALENWVQALDQLRGELAFRLPDLPRLLEDLSRRSAEPVAGALSLVGRDLSRLGEESFAAIWSRSLAEKAGELTQEDLEPLCRLGAVLGRCGWEEQRAAAEHAGQDLSRRAALLREDLGRRGKACGALGLSLGAFLAILLL